jgi:hypothetical protein
MKDVQKIDLSLLQDVEPEFDTPPQITGLTLEIQGHYPSQTSEIEFKFSYLYEHPEWKLLFIYMGRRKTINITESIKRWFGQEE